jgi:2-(1,2-epoxy-1,2-dihydrophenyl)acetyl-CoA isomerase
VDEYVTVRRQDGVATVTLNRPVRHNSFVPAMLEQLRDSLQDVSGDPGVRVILLRAGGRSFSTGGDVAGFARHQGRELAAYAHRLVGLLNDAILIMLRAPQPIVGAVHGIVTGGALGLVLACDVVYLTPAATFTPYYSVVGFSPDGGWTALLPEVIGTQRVSAILAQNRTISAAQAVEWGMATALVAEDDLAETVENAVALLLEKRPGAIRHGKGLLLAAMGDVRAALEREREAFVQQILTDEAREGMERFLGDLRAPTASR